MTSYINYAMEDKSIFMFIIYYYERSILPMYVYIVEYYIENYVLYIYVVYVYGIFCLAFFI